MKKNELNLDIILLRIYWVEDCKGVDLLGFDFFGLSPRYLIGITFYALESFKPHFDVNFLFFRFDYILTYNLKRIFNLKRLRKRKRS